MQLSWRLISLTLLGLALPAIAKGVSPSTTSDTPETTGRLIVELRADKLKSPGLRALQGDIKSTDSVSPRRWAASKGLKYYRGVTRNTHLLVAGNSTSDSATLQRIAKSLQVNAEIERASVEYRRYPLLQPNDPLYRGDGTTTGNQNYLYEGEYSLRAPGAWDITTGSASTVIAVVDTGILADHPDLSNRSIPFLGYDFVSADLPGDFTSANDGDGRDANPTDPGDHCGPNPSSWHGTGVASVAAGTANNAEGIAGVDWNARLLHARALGRCGGTDADIIDAVRWSAGLPVSRLPVNDTPASVLNLSIGGPTECTPAWQAVIDELNDLNIPFVIAAGNERTNALRSSPANCADVITVGSHTPGGDLDSGFSNYGLKVTIAAPGRNILLATNDGFQAPDALGFNYSRETGSSFSAALVSGAIGLMKSLNADLSPTQVRAILQSSATEFSSDSDCGMYYCGGGILNLARAMQITRDASFDDSFNREMLTISSQVTKLELGERRTGTLSGYRDIHYFELPVADSGLLTIISDSSADVFGYLLNDNFSVLTRDDDSHTGLNFRLAMKVEPGTYYVALERAKHSRGDGEEQYAIESTLSMEQPTPFSFTPVTNAAFGTNVFSEVIQISGLTESAIVTVTEGAYSINGGDFTREQGQVNNGDTITVTLQAPANSNSTAGMTITVGAYSTGFTVSTGDGSPSSTVDTSGTGAEQSRGGGCTLMATGQTDLILLLLLTAAPLALQRTRR